MCPPPCGPRRSRIGIPRKLKTFPESWLNEKREYRDGAVYSLDGKTLVKADPKLRGDFVIPEGVERILADAFFFSNVKNVQFPSTLKKIGPRAFYDAMYLDKLIGIPETARIDRTAFNSYIHYAELQAKGQLC